MPSSSREKVSEESSFLVDDGEHVARSDNFTCEELIKSENTSKLGLYRTRT
jgi:hypothetical protein